MLNPRATIVLLLPAEFEEQIRSELRRVLPFLPSWLEKLVVQFQEEEGSNSAAVEIQYHYRQATLTLYRNYLNQTPEDKLDTLCHEFGHILIAPYTSTAERLLKDEGKKVRSILEKAEEEAVSDLAKTLAASVGPYEALGDEIGPGMAKETKKSKSSPRRS